MKKKQHLFWSEEKASPTMANPSVAGTTLPDSSRVLSATYLEKHNNKVRSGTIQNSSRVAA